MKITDLAKRFDGFSLYVERLNLAPGQIHGLIGHNGSGKTTLMKLIAGLLDADSGVIDYQGLTRRDITMIPRKPYFLHDSVYKNLVYPLTLRGIKPDPERVDYFLSMIGLKDRRKQYAPSLSSGEQQKLSIIRALIFSPKLVLVDEAFSNLDIESICMFEQFILERQQKEPAMWVVISHQLSHIQRLCGHLFFMDHGRIEAEGATEEILLQPQKESLQRYLRHATVINRAGDTNGFFEG